MKIVLDINPEFYEFAKAMGKSFDDVYYSPEDYLMGLLNMAVITQMDHENYEIDYGYVSPVPGMDDEIPF